MLRIGALRAARDKILAEGLKTMITRQEKEEIYRQKEETEQRFEALLKEQNQNCMILGQEYFRLTDSHPELALEELASYAAQVKVTEKRIQETQDTLAEQERRLAEPVGNICPGCGKEMSGDARFCSNCGTMLQKPQPTQEIPQIRICRNCGSPLGPGVRFCGKCGTAAV